MQIAKNILKYLFTIILIVCIIGLAVIKIFSSTILNESYVFKMLKSTGYYESIYEELKNNFENYIAQSGLDESVINDICTEDDIQAGVETILGNIYEGTAQSVDSSQIREKLETNISNSLEGTTITDDMQSAIDAFVDIIMDEYKSTMSHTKYENTINEVYKKITKIIGVAQIATCIGILISMIVIIVLNIKKIYKALSLIGIALTSSGALLTIVNIIVNKNVKVQNIKILNDSISNTLRSIITDILSNILAVGCVLFVIGILIIILSSIFKVVKEEEKNKKRETVWKR